MNIPNVLLEITVYSGLIYCFIMLFKKILSNKVSPFLYFLIWFLLIARLLVPVTFDSNFSFIVIPENTVQQVEVSDTPGIVDEVGGNSTNNVEQNYDTPISQESTAGSKEVPAVTNKNQSVKTANTKIPWQMLIVLIWIGGMVFQIVRTIGNGYRLKRTLKDAERETHGNFFDLFRVCRKQFHINREIPLYLTDKITTPTLTMGPCPAVVMPYSAIRQFNDEQNMFAMKHELMHFKRKDHITGLLIKILEVVYWFNPIVWLMDKRMMEDIETACDNAVVRSMQSEEKKAYALTLVRLFSTDADTVLALGMALENNQVVAEKRIRGIYQKSKSTVVAMVGAIVLCTFAFVGCFTTSLQPAYKEQAQAETPTESMEFDATSQAVFPPVKDEKAEDKTTTTELPESYEPNMEIQTNSSEEQLAVGFDYSYTNKEVEYEPVSFSTSFDSSERGRRI